MGEYRVEGAASFHKEQSLVKSKFRKWKLQTLTESNATYLLFFIN